MENPPRIEWPVPEIPPVLGPDEIHVWCAQLDSTGDGADAASALYADELVRARGLPSDEDRSRYVASRLVLRRLLAFHLDTAPEALAFGRDPQGHAVVMAPTAESNLRFNLSRSGPLALFALARGRPVGVDLEQVREFPDIHRFEERVFAPDELGWQRAREPSERRREFFRRWTLREAAFKARGQPGGEPVSHELAPADPFVGAVSFAGTPSRIAVFQWESSALSEAGQPRVEAAIPQPT